MFYAHTIYWTAYYQNQRNVITHLQLIAYQVAKHNLSCWYWIFMALIGKYVSLQVPFYPSIGTSFTLKTNILFQSSFRLRNFQIFCLQLRFLTFLWLQTQERLRSQQLRQASKKGFEATSRIHSSHHVNTADHSPLFQQNRSSSRILNKKPSLTSSITVCIWHWSFAILKPKLGQIKQSNNFGLQPVFNLEHVWAIL